ncbi:MAG: DMT family transporter [Spirochaetales bacterium]|nr:DMT family transporter [Spirochaetales bacterium]
MIIKKHSVVLKALVASLLWSTSFVGLKIGLAHAEPFFLAGIRCFLAGIILIPFSGHIRLYMQTLWSNRWFIFKLSILQTVLMYGLYNSGIDLIPGSIAALIFGTSPLITAIITHIHLRNDKLTGKKLFTILMGISGIIFIVSGRQILESVGIMDLFGIILLILTLIVSAYSSIIVSKFSGKIDPIILNSSQLWIGGFILIIISIPVEGVPDFSWNLEFILALAWLSFLTATAFSLWYSLLKTPNIKVSELEMWKFLIPVFGAVLSWIILPNDAPTFISIFGMIVIALSIIIYFMPRKL